MLSVDIVTRRDLGFRAGLSVEDVSLSEAYCKIDAAGPEGSPGVGGRLIGTTGPMPGVTGERTSGGI